MKACVAYRITRLPLRASPSDAFTLTELLVVLAVVALLASLYAAWISHSTARSHIAHCASHVRALTLASQIYANENQDRLPNGTAAAWAWDLADNTARPLLGMGCKTNTFYCPGTQPRFTDWENFREPGSAPAGNLWNYGMGGNPLNGFHIIGYALAFSASTLAVSNQNKSILPEQVAMGPNIVIFSPADRVLVADANISVGALTPGDANPGNNYTSIAGGFQQNGLVYPHLSAHLQGPIPVGGNAGFKDGHVQWRKFRGMTPRTVSGTVFWW